MTTEQKSLISLKSTVIKNLWKIPKWREKILILMTRILRPVEITEQNIIDVIGKNDKNDKKIFDELSKLNKSPIDLYTEEYDTRRAFGKWKNMRTNLTKNIESILDMGGNVGNIASVLGHKILKIPTEKITVVDVENWEGQVWVPRTDITFVNYNNISKIPDNSVDLITMFHTLHHIPTKEYGNILKTFHRILTKDGCMVLYEHNCSEKNWAGLIDIEHALFDVVVSKKKIYSTYVKTYYSKYLSIIKWESLFKKAGFNKYFQTEIHNTDNSVYMYFQKA
jgi:ubiquinone/menaquinone biosynthesis C-methylase UbiE